MTLEDDQPIDKHKFGKVEEEIKRLQGYETGQSFGFVQVNNQQAYNV